MNSQKYNKEEIYPEDYTEDDKIEYDILFEQSKVLFPKLATDDWLIKMGVQAFLRKKKQGDTEPPSQEEIAKIRNQYSKDTVFYTEPIEPEIPIENVIISE